MSGPDHPAAPPPPRERVDLQASVGHVLDEARMILPGVQALFGFQLIAVFNGAFWERVDPDRRPLHFLALVLIAAVAGLLMAPAAYHRQAESGWASRRFVALASRLLALALAPLIAAITIDLFIIGELVLASTILGAVCALAVAVLLVALWYVLPRRVRASD